MSTMPALALLACAAVIAVTLAWYAPRSLGRRTGRRVGVGSLGPNAAKQWQQVGTVVLDPMRSLTTGHLVVTEVQAVDPDHERNLRWFAGALAHGYDDPVGRAVAKLAGRARLTNVTTEPGLGIRGSVDRHPVRVGERDWIGFTGTTDPSVVGTTVAVEVDQRPLGQITVAEEVRRDASGCLDRLRRLGVTPVLASPATPEAVSRVATLAASPTWHAPVDPQVLARELSVEGPVGLAAVNADGSATLHVIIGGRAAPDPQTSIDLHSASADVVSEALALTRRVFRARQRGLWTVAVLTAVATATVLLTRGGSLWICVTAAVVVVAGTTLATAWGFANAGDISDLDESAA